MATESSTQVLPARRTRRTGAAARAVYIVWYRDVLRFWRDRARVVGSLAQPLFFLVVFGIGLGSSLGVGFPTGAGSGSISYLQFMFPGVIAMAVLFSAVFGAMSIVWDREFGFLKEVLVAPVSRSSVAIGKALGGATQALIQGAMLLILAPFIGVKLTVESVLLLIPFLFLLAFSMSAMGVAIASRMTSMQGFQIIVNFLLMPMFFLSGALFPLQGLPDWMAVLTRLNPVTYGIDPIRRIVLAAEAPGGVADELGLTIFGQVVPIWLEGTILLIFGVVMLGLGVVNFRRRD